MNIKKSSTMWILNSSTEKQIFNDSIIVVPSDNKEKYALYLINTVEKTKLL